jgi:hypothetical protein
MNPNVRFVGGRGRDEWWLSINVVWAGCTGRTDVMEQVGITNASRKSYRSLYREVAKRKQLSCECRRRGTFADVVWWVNEAELVRLGVH